MNSDEYQKIYKYLKYGKIPLELDTSHSRFGFKRKCRGYEIDEANDELYYISKHKDGSTRRKAKVVVGSKEQAKVVFRQLHLEKPSPHQGVNRSLQQISKKYFWPKMTYDIMKWIKECPVCLKSKEHDKAKLSQLKVYNAWDLLSMNILGPFNETPEGYKYILTVMDFYSKWVEAFPICNKSPADVTVCLKLLYYRHGAWKSILSNEGEEFLEKVKEALCKQLGGDHQLKVVFHPQVMTLEKKCDKEITRAFSTLVLDRALDWPHYIDPLLFTLRTTKHTVTNFTPFYLFHKREARIPPVLEGGGAVASIDSESNLNDIFTVQYKTSKDRSTEIRTHNSVIASIQSANNEQMIENALAMSNDRNHNFTVGEKVLFNGRKRTLDWTSQSTQLNGPYIVTEVKPNKVKLMLKSDFTQTRIVTEISRLVPYKECFKLSMFEPSGADKSVSTVTNANATQIVDNGHLEENDEESFA